MGLLSEPNNIKQQNDPITPLNQKFATLEDLNKHYNLFLSRIQQQLSTLGGGGESNLTYIDVPVTYVTSSTYSITHKDYYIGVNYAGAVTITLPKSDREGKIFIVKDELGEASKGTNRYITTASLPLRYEISNVGITTSSSKMKQVCSSVISEGGYELSGIQQAVGTAVTSPKDLPSPAGNYYPIISIRLKSSPNRLDSIVILSAISLMGIGNGPNYNWRLLSSATTTGGTWISAGNDSSVEYNINGTGVTGGIIKASGFFSSTNQSTSSVNIPRDSLFKFQLERNGLTKTPYELTLVCSSDTAGADVYAALDWEEISK